MTTIQALIAKAVNPPSEPYHVSVCIYHRELFNYLIKLVDLFHARGGETFIISRHPQGYIVISGPF